MTNDSTIFYYSPVAKKKDKAACKRVHNENLFYANTTKTGLPTAVLDCKLSLASANKEYSTILCNKCLGTE